jgi:uncharacterized protein DUF1236
MRAVSILALGAALASTGAQAQVISRSVSEEPVETIVTQTPNGTVVTRRPLGTEPMPYRAPAAIVEAPYRAPAMVETAPDTVDAITTREVVRRVETRPRLATRPVALETRKTIVRKSARVDRPAERVVTRTARAPVATIALSPAERHIVYQTIVEQNVLPAPRVVAPAYRETWRDQTWRDQAWRDQAWRDQSWRDPYWNNAPVVAADEDVEFATPTYAVGAVLPSGVPLFAVPREVSYRVPAARPYSYAYVGGRAYLVDPASSVIVADVTE